MKKILAIGYGKNLFRPGVERDRQLELVTEDVSIHMMVFLPAGTEQEQHDGNWHIYPSGGHSRISLLVQAYRTGARIIKNHPHTKEWVVTTQDPFEAGLVGFLLAKRFGIPVNIQEHGDFFSLPFWRREAMLNRLRYRFGLWLLRRVDSVRVVSQRIADTLQHRGVQKEKITVLPVAIPLDRFLSVNPVRPTTPPVHILTVARLVSQKNIDLLLRAFARVVAVVPSCTLRIVGDGPEKSRLIATAATLGVADQVEWLPWSNDVPSLLAKAHIYALSSNYEGYARVIPEAMAAGLPVVMTDVGCAGELCIDQVHGLVVPVADEVALAQALILLAKDEAMRVTLGQTGKVAVEQRILSLPEYGAQWRAGL